MLPFSFSFKVPTEEMPLAGSTKSAVVARQRRLYSRHVGNVYSKMSSPICLRPSCCVMKLSLGKIQHTHLLTAVKGPTVDQNADTAKVQLYEPMSFIGLQECG